MMKLILHLLQGLVSSSGVQCVSALCSNLILSYFVISVYGVTED
jgi:hypothetical protein